METNENQLNLNPNRIYKNTSGWLKDGETYSAIPDFTKVLSAGIYYIEIVNNSIAFTKTQINTDSIIKIKGSEQETILQSLESFWGREADYSKAGIIYKRGFLLHGKPGCGKTVLVGQVCDSLIEKNGIALIATEPNLTIAAISQLRQIEPDRKLIVLYEDLEGYLAGFGEENLLSLFDGQRQVKNIVHICTTNYLSDIPDRFKNRPSRIDEVIEIKPPSSNSRKLFIVSLDSAYKSNTGIIIDSWVIDTKGMSFAHIKELFIATVVLGYNYNSTIKRLRSKLTENDDDGSGFFG